MCRLVEQCAYSSSHFKLSHLLAVLQGHIMSKWIFHLAPAVYTCPHCILWELILFLKSNLLLVQNKQYLLLRHLQSSTSTLQSFLEVRFPAGLEGPDSEHGPSAGTWWLPQEGDFSNSHSQIKLNNLPEETPWVLDIYNSDWISRTK